ncbi:MAG: Asparagine synthetase [Parcubacteria group bacterium GW2011_GWA2_51_10]|nr:MAG: Asparagine synthetase [Parcubacteria group bacterium GW2011_GWA2_51_10]
MCGIAGFYGEGDEDTLERMSETLARRGPDDAGIWKHKNIGLAHTRLSIIDLSSAGHQPMTSSTGKTSIVFNGEIYNYREIKKEIRESYKFGSSTDTEVILALYEERGVKAFESLNGMFAFALYDHGTATLYLVRDRMGKKPLYWGVFDGTLIFGSELKALMQHEKFKKEIDPEAVRTYLVYECVPTPLSIFKGVRKVRAGEYVAFLGGKEPREESFWNLKREPLNITFTEALAVLDKKIVSAVERRLESDVPLGVFLSGGLDSSTISWYAQKASAAPVNTFSIGFTDKDFDESRYAHAVAGKLGVHHTMEVFSPCTGRGWRG